MLSKEEFEAELAQINDIERFKLPMEDRVWGLVFQVVFWLGVCILVYIAL